MSSAKSTTGMLHVTKAIEDVRQKVEASLMPVIVEHGSSLPLSSLSSSSSKLGNVHNNRGGLDFLQTRNSIFLSYLIDMTFHLRCQLQLQKNASEQQQATTASNEELNINHDIVDCNRNTNQDDESNVSPFVGGGGIDDTAHHHHLDRLLEMRTVLEKMRGIEKKIRYQLDKLVAQQQQYHAGSFVTPSIQHQQQQQKQKQQQQADSNEDPLTFRPNVDDSDDEPDEEEYNDDDEGSNQSSDDDDVDDTSNSRNEEEEEEESGKDDDNDEMDKEENENSNNNSNVEDDDEDLAAARKTLVLSRSSSIKSKSKQKRDYDSDDADSDDDADAAADAADYDDNEAGNKKHRAESRSNRGGDGVTKKTSTSATTRTAAAVAPTLPMGSTAIYRAPRLAAMPYTHDDHDRIVEQDERLRRRLRASEVADALRHEFGDAPEQDCVDGGMGTITTKTTATTASTSRSGGYHSSVSVTSTAGRFHAQRLRTAQQRLAQQQAERIRYEEDNFVRLPTSRQEKKERKQLQRQEMSNLAVIADGIGQYRVEDKNSHSKRSHADTGRSSYSTSNSKSNKGKNESIAKKGFQAKNSFQSALFEGQSSHKKRKTKRK